jgi:hypothetical protein
LINPSDTAEASRWVFLRSAETAPPDATTRFRLIRTMVLFIPLCVLLGRWNDSIWYLRLYRPGFYCTTIKHGILHNLPQFAGI